jgi:hypothetical protein
MKTYIGIDNGATGSVGMIFPNGDCVQERIPSFKALNYQKKKQFITRVDHAKLKTKLLSAVIRSAKKKNDGVAKIFALVERPFTGQNAKTVSAGMRAFEAVLITLEQLSIPYQIVDSKEWQSELLPSGIKGSPALKSAGKDVAKKLFPSMAFKGDADGILITEYARRKNL